MTTTVGVGPCPAASDAANPPDQAPRPGLPRWLEIYRRGLPARPPALPPPGAEAHQGLRCRVEEWLRIVQPRDVVERDLAERAAHLSWTLEQAQEVEQALWLSRPRAEDARQAARAEVLGRRLLGEIRATKSRGGGADLPAVLLRRLEGTAEGCRWLLDRWSEFATLTGCCARFGNAELFRLIRLLGKEPLDAAYDEELQRILAACEGLQEGMATRFLEACQALVPPGDPTFRGQRAWRPLVERFVKQGHEDLNATLLRLVHRQTEHIKALLRQHECSSDRARGDSRATAAGRAIERLQRLQTARSRELRQVIELLRKLTASRREEADRPQTAAAARPSPQEAGHAPPSAPRPEARRAAPAMSQGPRPGSPARHAPQCGLGRVRRRRHVPTRPVVETAALAPGRAACPSCGRHHARSPGGTVGHRPVRTGAGG